MASNMKNKIKKTENTAEGAPAAATGPDLSKLKKREILEIMLKQGEKIDTLRARIEELEAEIAAKEAELQKHEFDIQKFGSIAEAALQVTNIFEEAEEAARIYLENLRRRYE